MTAIRKGLRSSRGREKSDDDFEGLIGTSPDMVRIWKLIRGAAGSRVPVLITGPAGTEKEAVAKAIHLRSPRAAGPFVVVNCAGIRRELMESEFFGHKNGDYLGLPPMAGKVELAAGGTFFLQEVEKLTWSFQARMLHFLGNFNFTRVGGRKVRQVDLRLISAADHDLGEMVTHGEFRADLYHQLNGLTIELPDLKDRGMDVWLMAQVFLKSYAAKARKEIRGFTEQAKRMILLHPWPGNIPELQSCIRRAVVMAEKPWITPEDLGLPKLPRPPAHPDPGFREAMARFGSKLVADTLAQCRGNIHSACESLKVSRAVIYHLMKKYNL